MTKNNLLTKKCDICRQSVFVDQFGQGECENCGWHQNDRSFSFPDLVKHPNIVSLNKAKEFIKKGEPIKPSFKDFIEAFKQYGEMEFFYKSKKYGIMGSPDGIDFYEWDVEKGFQTYNNIEEFSKKANINGVLLSDLWKDVVDADYM